VIEPPVKPFPAGSKATLKVKLSPAPTICVFGSILAVGDPVAITPIAAKEHTKITRLKTDATSPIPFFFMVLDITSYLWLILLPIMCRYFR